MTCAFSELAMSLVVLIRLRSIPRVSSGFDEYGWSGCDEDNASWAAYSCTAASIVRKSEEPASELGPAMLSLQSGLRSSIRGIDGYAITYQFTRPS